MSRDLTLTTDQTLTEVWRIEYEPMSPAHRGPDRVRARMAWWPHGTHYSTSVQSPDISTARLQIVLRLARAICDDETAFKYDEDGIRHANTLAWLQGKLQELRDEEDAPEITVKRSKKLDKKIRFMERLIAEYQEDNDYWPDEEDVPGSEATRQADRRTAALRATRDAAEAIRFGDCQD